MSMSRTRRGKRANKAHNFAQSLIKGEAKHRRVSQQQVGKQFVNLIFESNDPPSKADVTPKSAHGRTGVPTGC